MRAGPRPIGWQRVRERIEAHKADAKAKLQREFDQKMAEKYSLQNVSSWLEYLPSHLRA